MIGSLQDSLFRPAAKRQRGDATGSRAKSLSAQRTQALFHTEETAQSVHPSRYGKDTRPIVAQSLVTQESDKDWVRRPCLHLEIRSLSGHQVSEVLDLSGRSSSPIAPDTYANALEDSYTEVEEATRVVDDTLNRTDGENEGVELKTALNKVRPIIVIIALIILI